MAKSIDPDKYVKGLISRTEEYADRVRNHYVTATNALLALSSGSELGDNDVFKFSDNPKVSAKATEILRGLYSSVYNEVKSGVKAEWDLANIANDELITAIFGKGIIEDNHFARWFSRNQDAMESFFARKSGVGGLNLSQRIWKYTGQLKDEMELALSVSLGEGKSASTVSKEVRRYLNEPNKLFRRIRDKNGNLKLSKAAKSYSPGQGVYRSSYKNAMRVTRTETNMAYREADWQRWQDLDFVTGFEVHRSKKKPEFDCTVCESLTGKYPKEFKFKGWHPQCFCYCTPILAIDDEFIKMQEQLLAGETDKSVTSVNLIEDVPSGFKKWVETNKDRIINATSTPYWIKDNFVNGDISKGLKLTKEIKSKKTIISNNVAQCKFTAKEMADAVDWYVSGDGMWINQYLRNPSNFGDIDGTEQKLLDALTEATDKHIQGHSTLYRSIDAKVLFGEVSDMEWENFRNVLLYGDNSKFAVRDYNNVVSKFKKEYRDKGFMSTTSSKDIAMDFDSFTGADKPVVLKIELDKTTRGLDLKKEYQSLNDLMGQNEVLLARGQGMELLNIVVEDGNIVVRAKMKPTAVENVISKANSTKDIETRKQKIKDLATKRHATRNDAKILKNWEVRKLYNQYMSDGLRSGAKYLQGEKYDFSKDFFTLIDPEKAPKLNIVYANKTSHYSPMDNAVNIFSKQRNIDSPYYNKSVIYHEFGHAIDQQKGLRTSKELLELRSKQLKRLNRKREYKVWSRKWEDQKGWINIKTTKSISLIEYLDTRTQETLRRLIKTDEKYFAKRGIVKSDIIEQFCGMLDTIMSFNPKYGYGHSKAYWKHPGMKEAEYLAHAFENAFSGNPIFKKYLPEIYEEMIYYVKQLE